MEFYGNNQYNDSVFRHRLDKVKMGGTGNVPCFRLPALPVPSPSKAQGAFPPSPGAAAANPLHSPDSTSPLANHGTAEKLPGYSVQCKAQL